MKHFFLFLILLIISVQMTPAQPPDTLWTRTYNDGRNAVGSSVEQTTDGGFIICGKSTPFVTAFHNVYLVKTDSFGDTIWTRRYGDNLPDIGNEVHQTMDGGYIIVGSYTPHYYEYDSYMIRTDCDGHALWERTYQFDYDSQAFSVCETSEGNFVFTGAYTDSSIHLQLIIVMTDPSGEEIWRYITNEYWDSSGSSILQCNDGNLILTGSAASFGEQHSDVLLMKIDLNGNPIWIKTYGGDHTDVGYSISKTQDGGYVIGGSFFTLPNSSDFYIVKTDSIGDTLWTNTFGFIHGEYAYGIDQTSDGGYVLAGNTISFAVGGLDCYMVKTDENGEEIWSSFIRGEDQDEFKDVQQTIDGGYICTGQTTLFNPTAHGEVYLVKYDADNNQVEDFGKAQVCDFTLYPTYPNPFNASTVITFELATASNVTLDIFDVTGRNVGALHATPGNALPENQYMPAGTHQIVFDGEGLTSGVYFVWLEAGNFIQTRKMLLIK